MLKGVLIDVNEPRVKVMGVNDDLSSFYSILDCSCIDIVTRTIDGKEFTFVCDDEGLLKANSIPSAFSSTGTPMLVGSLFIVTENSKTGQLQSLSLDDVKYIKDYISITFYVDTDTRDKRIVPVLHHVDYVA